MKIEHFQTILLIPIAMLYIGVCMLLVAIKERICEEVENNNSNWKEVNWETVKMIAIISSFILFIGFLINSIYGSGYSDAKRYWVKEKWEFEQALINQDLEYKFVIRKIMDKFGVSNRDVEILMDDK